MVMKLAAHLHPRRFRRIPVHQIPRKTKPAVVLRARMTARARCECAISPAQMVLLENAAASLPAEVRSAFLHFTASQLVSDDVDVMQAINIARAKFSGGVA
jgi:hypothetical protein